jgi:opine dehydrogenase
MRDHYEPQGDAEWMYGRKGHTDLVKSEKWREKLSLSHRYVVEDVKCNLTLLTSLARRFGVEAPIGHALVTLIGAAAGEDFRQTGRTLERLGLGGVTLAELTDLLRSGLPA